MTVAPADNPTVNGGLAGTTTHDGVRYLFGASQGQLMHGTGAKVRQPGSGDHNVTEARAFTLNSADDAGWIIVVPDTISINELEWRLVAPDGSVVYEAKGLEPKRP